VQYGFTLKTKTDKRINQNKISDMLNQKYHLSLNHLTNEEVNFGDI